MTVRRIVASLLVRCYPAAWRREYGAELHDLLERRPVGLAGALDVVVSGLRQRVAVTSPSTRLGVLTMGLVVLGVAGTPGGRDTAWLALVRPSGISFPTANVAFFSTDVFTLLLLWCGWRTEATRAAAWYDSGLAAARMTLIGGLPVILVGLLFALNAVDFAAVPATKAGWMPSPLAMMIAPLARAPQSWIWGVFGGWLARRFSPSKPAPQAL